MKFVNRPKRIVHPLLIEILSRGVTLQQAAEALGVTDETLRKLFSGRTEGRSAWRKKVAEAFDKPEKKLFPSKDEVRLRDDVGTCHRCGKFPSLGRQVGAGDARRWLCTRCLGGHR